MKELREICGYCSTNTYKAFSFSNKGFFFCNELGYLDCFPVPNPISVYYRDLERNILYAIPIT